MLEREKKNLILYKTTTRKSEYIDFQQNFNTTQLRDFSIIVKSAIISTLIQDCFLSKCEPFLSQLELLLPQSDILPDTVMYCQSVSDEAVHHRVTAGYLGHLHMG